LHPPAHRRPARERQDAHSMSLSTLLILAGLVASLVSGTVACIVADMFPTRVRFTGVALGFDIVFTIFSGTAPLIATSLIRSTGDLAAPALLMMLCAAINNPYNAHLDPKPDNVRPEFACTLFGAPAGLIRVVGVERKIWLVKFRHEFMKQREEVAHCESPGNWRMLCLILLERRVPQGDNAALRRRRKSSTRSSIIFA
jgi:hypothetical protein